MSYITLTDDIPSSKRFTLSLWFRVPSESIAAAAAEYAAWEAAPESTPRPPLLGIVPLVVFGSGGTFKGYQYTEQIIGDTGAITFLGCTDGALAPMAPGLYPGLRIDTNPTPGDPVGALQYSFDVSKNNPIDPSHIGIACKGGGHVLSVKLVMPSDNTPTARFSTAHAISSNIGPHNWVINNGPCVPEGFYRGEPCSAPPMAELNLVTTWASADEFTLKARPETFSTLDLAYTGDFGWAGSSSGGSSITPDVWQHLLLSVDLTNSVKTHGWLQTLTEGVDSADGLTGTDGATSITGDDSAKSVGSRTTSACRMFIALDDNNLTGKNLSAYYPTGYSDKNAVLTVNAYTCASTGLTTSSVEFWDCLGNAIFIEDKDLAVPTYTYKPVSFDFEDDDADMGLPAHSEFVNAVKHCEMAEFQLYTDVAINTGIKDNRRAFITDKGTPAPMSVAKELIGKKAEVILHGSTNWKRAKNTGTTSSPLNINPTVGEIDKFTPNPKLGK